MSLNYIISRNKSRIVAGQFFSFSVRSPFIRKIISLADGEFVELLVEAYGRPVNKIYRRPYSRDYVLGYPVRPRVHSRSC